MREPGTPDVENLYARLGTGAPHLCFAGHTDVVPAGDEAAWTQPPFGGEIADGVLYGRGAVDMKGGIACFLAAALELSRRQRRPAARLALVPDHGRRGVRRHQRHAQAAGVAEGARRDARCLPRRRARQQRGGGRPDQDRPARLPSTPGVIVHGKQGHSAYGERAENPIPKLARIIDRLSSTPLDAGSAHFQPSSLQATIVSVPNSATNVIPGSARANFNIRYNDLHTAARHRGVGAGALRGGGARRWTPASRCPSRAPATCS